MRHLLLSLEDLIRAGLAQVWLVLAQAGQHCSRVIGVGVRAQLGGVRLAGCSCRQWVAQAFSPNSSLWYWEACNKQVLSSGLHNTGQ